MKRNGNYYKNWFLEQETGQPIIVIHEAENRHAYATVIALIFPWLFRIDAPVYITDAFQRVNMVCDADNEEQSDFWGERNPCDKAWIVCATDNFSLEELEEQEARARDFCHGHGVEIIGVTRYCRKGNDKSQDKQSKIGLFQFAKELAANINSPCVYMRAQKMWGEQK